jgi:hypothetical protein
MFFFGGFGSLISCTIYISVVWICILIGYRSQLFSFLLTGNRTENISVAGAGSEIADQKYYVLDVNKLKDEIPDSDATGYTAYTNYKKADHFITRIFLLPGRIMQNVFVTGNLLRAPPFHWISFSF